MAAQVSAMKFYGPHYAGDEKKIIFGRLTCTSISHLYTDLEEFYKEKDKPQKNLLRQHSKWERLVTLYEDMNTFYPEVYKLFILDDAEDIGEVLDMLNHICRIMLPTIRPLWKIIVTAQKHPLPSRYPEIQASDFIQVPGFNLDDTKKFFGPNKLEMTTVEQIHDVLGSSPLAMAICMKSLESYQASQ